MTKIKRQLSRYFTLSEFTRSRKAQELGISNTPTEAEIEQLRATAQEMDKVRELLGQPIIVNSAFRSERVNRAVGGTLLSQHRTGHAVDFVSPKFGTPLEICTAIANSDIKFDQLIEEGTWVHISFHPRNRRQVLTMRNGRYTAGLLRPRWGRRVAS